MTALKFEKIFLSGLVAIIAGFVTGYSVNAAQIQYQYDDLNRLVRVIYDENTSIEYTYDAVGNRTRRSVTGAGTVSPDLSTVDAITPILADGISTSTITITAIDTNGNPMQDIAPANIIVSSTGTGNVITQPTTATDGSGQTTASMSSTVAEAKTISVMINGIAITDTALVQFQTSSNHPPVLLAIGNQSVNENSLLSFTISATGADSDPITYSATGLPTGALFVGQAFAWTPNYDQAGTYTMTFTASDGTAQVSETITITVNNVNAPPVLGPIGNQTASAGSVFNLTISATDADDDEITYSASPLPTGASLNPATGAFTWTPTLAQTGAYTVTFSASDGTAEDSETITIAVNDAVPPTVANLSPAAGAIQAPLDSMVILHITDAGSGVDASTVQLTLDGSVIYTGDVSVYNSAIGTCRRTGAPADYTYAYQSDEPFDFDQLKTVTVNASDLGGLAMAEQSYSFHTEMRSFGKNTQVSLGLDNLNCGGAATVCDGSGNIWVVWHAGPAGGRDIYLNTLAAGATSFGPSVRLTSNGADQANPAIALGSNGRLYVVWQDNSRGNWDIYGSTSANGTTWSTHQRIADADDNESFNQVNPALAVDGRTPSHAYVVWQDDRAGNYDIYIAESIDAFATNVITQVTSNTSNQTSPAVAANSAGTAYILWTDARNVANVADIYGASGSPWTNVPVVSKLGAQSSPVIAVESGGSVLHIVWVDDTAGYEDIYYASSNGLPASPMVGANIVDDTQGESQVSPAIAVTGTGGGLKVFACWHDERNISGGTGDTDIYMVQTNSGSGTNIYVGDGGTNSDQTEPAMGIDQSGHPYFVWTDTRGTNPGICYAASTYMGSSALASGMVSASSSETVGPASITNVDDVSIAIPAGACPYDVTISITKVDNPPEFSLPILNGYEFSPSGLELNAPVTITIPFEVSSTAGTPAPYWYDSLTGTLSQQGIDNIEIIQLTSTLHALRFTTTHLTPYYVLLGAAPPPDDGSGGDTGAGGGGGGGGGGDGCALSPNHQASVIEYLLPYLFYVGVLLLVKWKDTRKKAA